MTTFCRVIGGNAKERLIATAVVTLSLLAGYRAFALPTNGDVAAGEAAISTPSTSTMRIEQKSSHAIINWNSFAIGTDESVNIAQPDSRSILLNRVSGNTLSDISGTLTANGRIFLLNPNGVLFASGSSVNVGGLVASTLAIRDRDFLSEKYTLFENGGNGSVVNRGTLNGGFIALLGNNTSNAGNIVTTRGTTCMAAGEIMTIDIDPSGLVALKVEQSAYDAQLKNSGIIDADDGRVIISATAADALLSSVVNNSGKIHAASMTERDGAIVIEGGTIINTGTFAASEITTKGKNMLDAGTWNADGVTRGGTITIDATGHIEQTASSRMTANGADGGQIHINTGGGLYLSGALSATGNTGQGGQIAITAPQTLLAGTVIEADGQNGGGSILIGGGWQGNHDDLVNAATTIVTKNSLINANALEKGNGGTVVIWSDHSTTFAGTIDARGGAQSGNGGNVEVSSREKLTISGQIAIDAPHGEQGMLLLDPRNITIDANATAPLFTLVALPDANPAEGDQHGSGEILELGNGNIIVTSPFDDFVATDAGAVRLYKPDGTLLSMLCGSTANDLAGETVTSLSGNHSAVTLTQAWSNAGQAGAGAVTWIDGTTGISGSISDANSLVGTTANDGSSSSVIILTNGNYVVSSPDWDNGTASDAGAVTWGNGLGGTVGAISAANSLVGSKKNDQVGTVTALTNGNYVISSPFWDKGTVSNAGAVTWSNGISGTVGAISAANSLVGSKTGDQVGSVTALTNGNYVVSAPNWDNGSLTNAGMVTLVNGLNGAVGTINAASSLVGSKKEDKVGKEVTALKNGNYVVISPEWDNGSLINAGAITWGNGVNGTVGTINTTNSLTGSATDDLASSYVTSLTNGNYVVGTPNWNNGSTTDAGAVTWANGIGGSGGVINATKSLVGSAANDGVASTVTALTNGNYVVTSPHWDNGATIDAGAVTWGDGAGGTVGAISVANSLIGSVSNDGTRYNITPLTNGNYVVGSPYWDNGEATNAGAITWGNGFSGTVGVINAANSLVGSTKNDYAGSESSGINNITALTNGNYVVSSSVWDRGTTANAGAVTWGDGLGGTVGAISEENSLVGSKTGDQVGSVTAMTNGSYVISSPLWNNGSLTNAGAITLLDGLSETTGAISSANSLVGSSKEDQLGIGGITPLRVGNMNGSFVVSSYKRSNETGWVEILAPNRIKEPVQQEYTSNPDTDNTFTPNQITALLNSGGLVILKANNDITINSPVIADNPLGNGGNLELNAGRSIVLNANIITDNGNLTMVSNDSQANGVVDKWRSTGNASITMAAGTTIDAGSGSVTIELRDGTGNTNRESGEITLRSITASTISAVNNGPTPGSGITLASGTLASGATSGSSIILAGKEFDNSANTRLSTTGTARWIVYSANPEATIKGGLISDFRHYNANHTDYQPETVRESGNGFIYNSAPGQLSVSTTLTSGNASSVYGHTPAATFGYTLSGFADNEDNADTIGLTGTMMLSGVPTATSNIGNYSIVYAGGLSSSAGFTFAAGAGLSYTVAKQPIAFDEINRIVNWQSDIKHRTQKVLSAETLFSNQNQTISTLQEGSFIGQRAVHATKISKKNGHFITGSNIEVPEIAETFFIFPLPENMFSHSDPDAVISLEVHAVNGSTIPSWMSFDPERKVISGRAPKEAKGEYRIELLAKDQFGGKALSVVLVIIG